MPVDISIVIGTIDMANLVLFKYLKNGRNKIMDKFKRSTTYLI